MVRAMQLEPPVPRARANLSGGDVGGVARMKSPVRMRPARFFATKGIRNVAIPRKLYFPSYVPADLTRGQSRALLYRGSRFVLAPALAFVVACGATLPKPTEPGPVDLSVAQRGDQTASEPLAAEPKRSADPERAELVEWLRTKLPPGGEIIDSVGKPVGLAHVLRNGDSLPAIAEAYVELTDIYLPRELSKAIQKENPNFRPAAPSPGERIVIPSVVKRAPKGADDERIGWPEDKHLRGVYVRGGTAGGSLYMPLLDRMAERGMNMIVLDSKDYDGLLTYQSKVPLAVETGAAKKAPIRDMARTVRFAHAKGIRVAMRVSCFEDEFIAHAKPDLVPRADWAPGRAYQIGWLDPANPEARGYIKDLVKEALDFGVDEIQLDYVRYPVLGVKHADFDATKGKTPKTIVIRDFVREVHALTQARSVPLSLDIFGIVAEGVRADIDALGQDPVLLAPECEVLSPMVYPSHYHAGYAGFEVPGNHPEIVGMATRKILAMLKHGKKNAIIRPWLQAASWNSPEYGPQYIASEVKSAIGAGSHGWLMWNPAQTYTVTWQALPPIERKKAAAQNSGGSGGDVVQTAQAD